MKAKGELPMSDEIEQKGISHRHSREKEQLINRLKRIEGQVRGIQNMVENDRYCVDIITQISAINAAMKKVSLQLMENHTKHCVSDAIKSGNGEESISELMEVFERLTKT
jgi:DNA-binding FrmR family transcriptional regulator